MVCMKFWWLQLLGWIIAIWPVYFIETSLTASGAGKSTEHAIDLKTWLQVTIQGRHSARQTFSPLKPAKNNHPLFFSPDELGKLPPFFYSFIYSPPNPHFKTWYVITTWHGWPTPKGSKKGWFFSNPNFQEITIAALSIYLNRVGQQWFESWL